MKAREFAEHHLLREARERVLAQKHETPAKLSRALAKARESIAPIDETIRKSQRTAEYCAWVVERFSGESWPDDIKAQISRRGVWLRELAEKARAEGIELAPSYPSLRGAL